MLSQRKAFSRCLKTQLLQGQVVFALLVTATADYIGRFALALTEGTAVVTVVIRIAVAAWMGTFLR